MWTAFMRNALAGRGNVGFSAPDGVVFAEIDPDTGLLAGPLCPKKITEAFLVGTVPVEFCDQHDH